MVVDAMNLTEHHRPSSAQSRAPLVEALLRHRHSGLLPLHVPAHKHGGGLPSLARLFGEEVFRFDVNAMPGLDTLDAPTDVIAEAQALAAVLFGADSAFFLVNGTSSGLHAMVMAAVRPGQSLLLPRSCHKAVFHAMVLADATPRYIPPRVDERFGVARNVSAAEVAALLGSGAPPAAVLVTQPDFYGLASDLGGIVGLARAAGAAVLVDEAHGCLSYVHDGLPSAAMRLGADLSAVSVHKHGGSLTQSALLLGRKGTVDLADVKEALNCLGTSSASYLLMASLDAARQQLAVRGRELAERVIELVAYARARLDATGVYFTLGGVHDAANAGADPTKLVINVRETGLSGFAVDDLLRRDYGIQVELGDTFNVMPHFSWADTREGADRLFDALLAIAQAAPAGRTAPTVELPEIPRMAVRPRAAFLARKRSLSLESAIGQVSGEMVMAYPPGIPFLCPGEVITRDVVEHLRRISKEPSCMVTGMADTTLQTIRVLVGD
jgi:arginine decarboxylase